MIVKPQERATPATASAPEPALAGAAGAADAASPRRRMLAAGPVVALVSLLAALAVTDAAGVPLRDPDHVAGRRLLIVFALVGVLIAADVLVRASRRTGRVLPAMADVAQVRRERWTAGRSVAVMTALISFYLTYLAYRNLKSVVPLIRPGELFDGPLASLDRSLFLGHDPAVIMHSVLGTGVATEALSLVYGLFFLYIPATLALALVFSPNLQAGLFYATAQSLNWLLGAASYFLLPALGPVYADPAEFAALPSTSVTNLQQILLDQRVDFLSDPATGTAQSIAAFSSLHISIFFTGALAAHVLGMRLRARVVAWVLLALTAMATIHLGWHYVVDDIGGLILGAAAVGLALVITGYDPRADRAAASPLADAAATSRDASAGAASSATTPGDAVAAELLTAGTTASDGRTAMSPSGDPDRSAPATGEAR
ncbi:phosphatase PAP2 family protein [Patulibacter americanus]|uniref:phosphatase PAP2 family protein n=1 Tax=Patulibacter americanus TaxID=588672 RepID=UPI0003B36AF1|nr:phosphatase PAP2 family protein [Patulibacter americanus]